MSTPPERESEVAEKKQKSGLREFFSYFKPHMGLFLMDMACATLASLIDLAFPMSRECP